MAHRSGRPINLTVRVDSGVRLLAKHRALLERTSVNRILADHLEDYADGTMDAARRTRSAAYVFGIVQEVRELRRRGAAIRRRPPGEVSSSAFVMPLKGEPRHPSDGS